MTRNIRVLNGWRETAMACGNASRQSSQLEIVPRVTPSTKSSGLSLWPLPLRHLRCETQTLIVKNSLAKPVAILEWMYFKTDLSSCSFSVYTMFNLSKIEPCYDIWRLRVLRGTLSAVQTLRIENMVGIGCSVTTLSAMSRVWTGNPARLFSKC